MISLRQAKRLRHGDVLHHVSHRNADGTPERWRVNGAVKTWKRDAGRVQVPLKYGMRSYDYLTEKNLDCVSSTAKQAVRHGRRGR